MPRGKIASKLVDTVVIDGRAYFVYGYYTPSADESVKFDYYEILDQEGDCITFGDQLPQRPSVEVVRSFVDLYDSIGG